MKAFSKFIVIFFLSIQLIILFIIESVAQKAIVLDKHIGVFVDSLENYKYLLFTDYSFNEFVGAQVFEYNNGIYKLMIYLKNDSVIEKEIDNQYIKQIKNRLRYLENDYIKGDTSINYTIYLQDGSVLSGKILTYSNQNIKLSTKNIGLVKVNTSQVAQIYNSESKKGKIDFTIENPHYTRYLYAPSAIPMDKGEGYFQDVYLVFVAGNYAVTDHATIGAGFTIMPNVNLSEQIFFVNAKIAYPISEKFYLGGGGLYIGIGDIGGNIGIGYAVGTYGIKDHNITLGVGYGITDNELMETPVFTFCGMTRISKRISLITENWFITASYDEEIPPDYSETRTVREFESLISYGLRFFGDKLSVDLAFINVPTTGELFFPGIPYVDFVVRF